MNELSNNTRIIIYQFLNGEILPEAIADWITTNPSIEDELGTESYLKLIALNYNRKDDLKNAEKILAEYTDRSEFNEWRIRNILEAMISKKLAIYEGLVQLTVLYRSEGINELSDFVGFESVMEDVNSGGIIDIPDGLRKQLSAVNWETAVVDYSNQFLQKLCDGEIKITEKNE